MPAKDIRRVVDVWTDAYEQLGDLPFVNYVQICESRGAMMGANNPHPHGQIWASASIPNEPSKEQLALQAYEDSHKSCLLCDYLKRERELGQRTIFENQHFSALVPFWAIWPFETLVISRRHLLSMSDL